MGPCKVARGQFLRKLKPSLLTYFNLSHFPFRLLPIRISGLKIPCAPLQLGTGFSLGSVELSPLLAPESSVPGLTLAAPGRLAGVAPRMRRRIAQLPSIAQDKGRTLLSLLVQKKPQDPTRGFGTINCGSGWRAEPRAAQDAGASLNLGGPSPRRPPLVPGDFASGSHRLGLPHRRGETAYTVSSLSPDS